MLNMKRVKIRMIEKNITNIEIAEKLKCNINTISRWLNEKNIENIEKFIDMLIMLDIDIKQIKKE